MELVNDRTNPSVHLDAFLPVHSPLALFCTMVAARESTSSADSMLIPTNVGLVCCWSDLICTAWVSHWKCKRNWPWACTQTRDTWRPEISARNRGAETPNWMYRGPCCIGIYVNGSLVETRWTKTRSPLCRCDSLTDLKTRKAQSCCQPLPTTGRRGAVWWWGRTIQARCSWDRFRKQQRRGRRGAQILAMTKYSIQQPTTKSLTNAILLPSRPASASSECPLGQQASTLLPFALGRLRIVFVGRSQLFELVMNSDGPGFPGSTLERRFTDMRCMLATDKHHNSTNAVAPSEGISFKLLAMLCFGLQFGLAMPLF